MENLKVMSNSIIRSTRTEIKKKKIIKIIEVKVRGTTTIPEVRLPIVAPVVSVVLIIHSNFFFFSAIIDKFGNNARHWLGLLNQNFVVRVIYTKYIALGNNKQWKRRKKNIVDYTRTGRLKKWVIIHKKYRQILFCCFCLAPVSSSSDDCYVARMCKLRYDWTI